MAPPIWDWIIVDGERRVLQTTPLEDRLDAHPSTRFRAGGFGVDRTHRATWAIQGDRLFLVEVHALAGPSELSESAGSAESAERPDPQGKLVRYTPEDILPEWPDGFAGWYSGRRSIRNAGSESQAVVAKGRVLESAETAAPPHEVSGRHPWARPVSIAVLTVGAGLVFYGFQRLLDGLSPTGLVGLLAVIVGARVILEGMAIAVRG